MDPIENLMEAAVLARSTVDKFRAGNLSDSELREAAFSVAEAVKTATNNQPFDISYTTRDESEGRLLYEPAGAPPEFAECVRFRSGARGCVFLTSEPAPAGSYRAVASCDDMMRFIDDIPLFMAGLKVSV